MDKAVETGASRKRGASAPPGRGYAQDTANDRKGPPEEQLFDLRNLAPLNDNKDI